MRDAAYADEVPLESESDWMLSIARSYVVEPEPELPTFACGSCGNQASVRRWYATPDPLMSPEYLCGRCAYAQMRDTVGTLAAVLFDLGASTKGDAP